MFSIPATFKIFKAEYSVDRRFLFFETISPQAVVFLSDQRSISANLSSVIKLEVLMI